MCGGNGNKPTGKPVKITLTITAEALYNANPQPTSQAKLIPYCSLSDDNLGKIPPGLTLNDFTSEVFDGNTVTWNGVSSDASGYRVLITSITNNPNFFSSEPHGNSGVMTATVKAGIGNIPDTYTIGFSIDPPGNDPAKPYGLDPKLQGHA